MAQPCTKAEAKAALRAAAFTITDPDSADHGRTLIHRRGSFTGADIDLAAAVADVDAAEEVYWGNSIFGHDLVVVNPRGTQPSAWSYDVPAPSREPIP